MNYNMKALEVKYKIRKFINGLLPKNRFSYKYKPFSATNKIKENIISRNKQISIISIVVFLLFFSFIITNTITGYITYQESVEAELNATKNILSVTQASLNEMTKERDICENNLKDRVAELTACNNKLSQSESYLVNCENERNELQDYTRELNELFANCESVKEELQSSYEDLSTDFSELIRNTPADVCCRPGIEVSEWSVIDNRIVCHGELVVNCTSGETNY